MEGFFNVVPQKAGPHWQEAKSRKLIALGSWLLAQIRNRFFLKKFEIGVPNLDQHIAQATMFFIAVGAFFIEMQTHTGE